jgi:DNA-binding response OmpR family regulator
MVTEDAPAPVLLVEDDADLTMALADVLALKGYDVLSAPDGECAVGLLQHHRPAALVVDLGLPRRDGIEVVRLARDRYGHTVPIIAITGYATSDLQRRAREAGCDLVLQKPFTLAMLWDALERLGAAAAPRHEAGHECRDTR